MKNRQSKKSISVQLFAAFGGVAICLALGVAYNIIRQNRIVRQQEEAARLAEAQAKEDEMIVIELETEAETEAPYVPPVDFEALLAENPDTVGWIRIPDTKIDYPIVQAEDNEHYLHVDFQGNSSVYGTIFLDCDSEADFSGRNHVLYGHHMKDGSMFKDVVKFKDKEFFREHRYFDIYTPDRVIHLKTAACYYSSSDGIVRKTQFESQDAFDAWVADRLAPCSFAELPKVQVPAMYVLVTCSYEMADARTLLFAVEADEDGQIVPTGRTGHLPMENGNN